MSVLPHAQFHLRIVRLRPTRARPAPVLVFKCSASGQHVNIHAFHSPSCCKTLWRFLFFSRSGALAVAGVANSIYVQQGMRVFHCVSLYRCHEARRNRAPRSYDPIYFDISDMLSQGLHVAVNEKKSLPVVIETKNVPVRPSKQHTCALELCPPIHVAPGSRTSKFEDISSITLARFGQAGTAVRSKRGGREGRYSTADPPR